MNNIMDLIWESWYSEATGMVILGVVVVTAVVLAIYREVSK